MGALAARRTPIGIRALDALLPALSGILAPSSARHFPSGYLMWWGRATHLQQGRKVMSRVLFDITPDPAVWAIFARERVRPTVVEEQQITAFPRKEIADLLSTAPVPTQR